MNRRSLLRSLGAGLAGILVVGLPGRSEGGPRRRAVRRHRRRVRRRIRRRVAFRMIHGRRFWVVPVGLAAGWELLLDNRVVVVQSTKYVVVDGARTEVLVVKGDDGKTEEINVVREDTPQNRANIEGSVLPEGDTKTPGVDSETDQ
jgi:hypothetical protein